MASSIAVMAIIIGLGSFMALRLPVTKELKTALMFIIINFAVPAIILNGVFNTKVTDSLLHKVLIIFIVSIVYHIIALVVTVVAAKLFGFSGIHANKMSILASFGNTGFIGIPLCATIFGPVGGLLAAIFDAALDLVIFTVAIHMLKQEGKFHIRQLKSVINPPLIAICFGLVAFAAGFEAPQSVKLLTDMLSGIAGPLAMLYIGMLIPPLVKAKKLTAVPGMWFPLSFRLLIIPVLTMIVLSVSFFDLEIKQIVIIQAAMPTFMLATVLFAKYANDEETAVITTIYSTLLSLITIPIISLFVVWLTDFG